jgi:hypothetical protein
MSSSNTELPPEGAYAQPALSPILYVQFLKECKRFVEILACNSTYLQQYESQIFHANDTYCSRSFINVVSKILRLLDVEPMVHIFWNG